MPPLKAQGYVDAAVEDIFLAVIADTLYGLLRIIAQRERIGYLRSYRDSLS